MERAVFSAHCFSLHSSLCVALLADDFFLEKMTLFDTRRVKSDGDCYLPVGCPIMVVAIGLSTPRRPPWIQRRSLENIRHRLIQKRIKPSPVQKQYPCDSSYDLFIYQINSWRCGVNYWSYFLGDFAMPPISNRCYNACNHRGCSSSQSTPSTPTFCSFCSSPFQ